MTYYHLGEVVHRRAEQYGKRQPLSIKLKWPKANGRIFLGESSRILF